MINLTANDGLALGPLNYHDFVAFTEHEDVDKWGYRTRIVCAGGEEYIVDQRISEIRALIKEARRGEENPDAE